MTNPYESSSDTDTDSELSDHSSADDAAEEFDLAAWVGQCYDAGYSPQQVLDAAREHLAPEVVDNDMALHNTRLLAAMAQEQQAVAPAPVVTPVVTVELVPDVADNDMDDYEGVEWESGEQQQPAQFAPADYDDWQQMAQADGTVVFANTVAAPFDVFTDLSPAPQEDCAICQETLSDPAVQSTVCTHVFHRQCIDDMTQSAIEWRCPLCRTAW